MKLIIILLTIFIPQIIFAQNFEINLKFIDPENKIDNNSFCNLTTYNKDALLGIKHDYTAEINDKKAIIKDTLSMPHVAMLGLNIGTSHVSYKIAIDPGASYQITYDVANRKFDILSDSKSDQLLRFFFKGLDSLYEEKDHRLLLHKEFITAKNTRSADSILKLVNNFSNDLRNFSKKIAYSNPDNIISPYILTKNSYFDLEEQKIYENFSDNIKKSDYGIALKESMDNDLRNSKIGLKVQLVNEEFMPIAGNTTAGNKILLDQQYFKKNHGKATLIEFWASWCAPCRESLKSLYPFYYQNKSKGFNVVLVSLDDDPNEWKKASVNDNYPWLNISDGKGHASETPQNYKITAIPANVLINGEGKIVARNIVNLEIIKQVLDR